MPFTTYNCTARSISRALTAAVVVCHVIMMILMGHQFGVVDTAQAQSYLRDADRNRENTLIDENCIFCSVRPTREPEATLFILFQVFRIAQNNSHSWLNGMHLL